MRLRYKFPNPNMFKLWLLKQVLNLGAKAILLLVPKVTKKHISTLAFSFIMDKYKGVMNEVYITQIMPCDRNYLNLLEATERIITYIAERDGYYESVFWFWLQFMGIYLQRYVPRVMKEQNVEWFIKPTGDGRYELWGEIR